jgi:zinc transport system ATP-binding protein
MSAGEARREGLIGAVLQRSEESDALPVSARDVVRLGASVREPAWRVRSRGIDERVYRALVMVGAEEYGNRLYRELSGGQRQRVRIARALASGAKILALDEPMVGVDPAGQRRFAELMDRLHAELSLTVLIVSHDVRAVAAGCDRIACLSRTLHYHAAPEGLTPAVLAEVFEHDVAAIFGDVHVHAHAAEDCPLDSNGGRGAGR